MLAMIRFAKSAEAWEGSISHILICFRRDRAKLIILSLVLDLEKVAQFSAKQPKKDVRYCRILLYAFCLYVKIGESVQFRSHWRVDPIKERLQWTLDVLLGQRFHCVDYDHLSPANP
jgi:hypothetical protein